LPRIARVTDRTYGVCYGHKYPITIGGSIIMGSPDTYANALKVARIGDLVRADCGHVARIVTGSPDVFANGIKIARLGDRVDGIYKATIISASSDVAANG
jgi:uncharacterized Zn-binding protein involved in type VI secretion